MDPWVSFLSEKAEWIFSDKVIQDGEEKMQEKDFPGGRVVKNLPASTGDTSLILIRGKDRACHRATEPVCHNYSACALEPTHRYDGARIPQLLQPMRLEPVLCSRRSRCKEKPANCNQRKTRHSNKDPAQPKIN